ncbi:uncharacterized protein LOC126265512 [Aethina tumida]|uniref:uncharacterized protein LOC126265512 n=1 Tax=Aethina tumida TaxID=116153 RepID=UPI002147D780|nr:uncharacterized protein LOC126265512 [Aethina tumida]
MDLQQINAVTDQNRKPISKLTSLQEGEGHLILGMRIVNGTFGKSVMVELEKTVVFLPNRATHVLEANIEKFEPEKYLLVFTGQQLIGGYSKPLATFQIVTK